MGRLGYERGYNDVVIQVRCLTTDEAYLMRLCAGLQVVRLGERESPMKEAMLVMDEWRADMRWRQGVNSRVHENARRILPLAYKKDLF